MIAAAVVEKLPPIERIASDKKRRVLTGGLSGDLPTAVAAKGEPGSRRMLPGEPRN
jgi:hypothetical protein